MLLDAAEPDGSSGSAFFSGDYGTMLLRAYEIKSEADIGGALVRRAFRMGTQYVKAGTKLSPAEVIGMRAANRQAMIDKGFIVCWPASGDVPVVKGKRIAVHMGGGRYDVIEGRVINDRPLTREEAKTMAEQSAH